MKSGHVVCLHIYVQSGTFNAWTVYTLYTLPSSYRPIFKYHSGDTRKGSYQKSNGKFVINPSGEIHFITAENNINQIEETSFTFISSE